MPAIRFQLLAHSVLNNLSNLISTASKKYRLISNFDYNIPKTSLKLGANNKK